MEFGSCWNKPDLKSCEAASTTTWTCRWIDTLQHCEPAKDCPRSYLTGSSEPDTMSLLGADALSFTSSTDPNLMCPEFVKPGQICKLTCFMTNNVLYKAFGSSCGV